MNNYKYFFYLLFFLSFCTIYSQNIDKLTITYGTKLKKMDLEKEMKVKNISDNVKGRVIEIYSQAKSIDYVLQYSNGKSIFKKSPTMEVDNKKLNIIEIMAGRNTIYYNDVSKKELLGFKTAYGRDFIIRYDSIHWKITNESKTVNNLVVFKATYDLLIKKHNGTFHKKVIAWFSPEISIPIGPKNFRGLPGVILELELGKLIFFLKKIELNKKLNFIIPEINNTIISENDFNDISIKVALNRLNKKH